jgi:hypothetical protein
MQNLRAETPHSRRNRTDSKDMNNDVRSEMLASAIPPKDVQFEWSVFLPQLVLHLFPPLMILQLIPDMYLRADHLALAVGLALIISGMIGSVWCGALSFFAGSLLIIWWFLKFEKSVAAARSKCCCRVNFPTRGHTMSLIIGIGIFLIGMWAEFRFGDGFSSEHWTFRGFVERALHNFGMGMVQIGIGVVIVFLVCFHWIALHYYIDRSSKRFVEDAQLRTWTQPNARNIFGRMFSEQIKLSPTSEYRICGKHIKCADEDQSTRWNGLDGHNMMRDSSYRNTNTDLTQTSDYGWATELFIPIDSSKFTNSKWRHLNAYMKKINDRPDNTYKHHVEPIRICSLSNAKGDIKWEKYDVDPNIDPKYDALDVPQPLLRFRVEYHEDEILQWRNTPKSGRAKNLTVRYLKLSLPPSEEETLSWHSSLSCVQGGDHISTRSRLSDEAAQARMRLNQPSQGGPYVAGFRVQHSNISKANGDYLYQFDPKIKRLDDKIRKRLKRSVDSHSGQTVRSYIYWQQETDGSSDDSKYRLFCDNSFVTTEAAPANPAIWRIVEPYYKMRVSQSHTDATDHCLFTRNNEMAPQSGPEIWPRAMMTDIGLPNSREKTTDNRYYWKVSGPPRKGWGSPAPPSVLHQPIEGLPQNASQPEEMTVSGFYRVKLELTIPRIVHIPLQKWLGST